MPNGTLLLREANASTTSLSAIVEKSQQKRPPLPEYDLKLRSCQLDLILLKKPTTSIALKASLTDEGFESDIDSLSIVSSDDSFTNNAPKTETDSANGSSYSDSDDSDVKPPEVLIDKESFDLVKCSCYSDVKFPDLLVFVIKEEALVFKFGNLDDLQKFYSSFNALKAVTNQKAYCEPIGAKFNLLQRTDNNGVTHIEISRQPKPNIDIDYEPTSIISINTPENYIHEKILEKMKYKKSVSNENLLDESRKTLRKVWTSSEDILDIPKKPERRKKLKGQAPAPPIEENILKGEFIRVNVSKIDQKPSIDKPKPFNILGTMKPRLTTYQQFKFSEPKKLDTSRKVNLENWTSSVPRMIKNQRSRSETRNFTPMAYRYIDTTQNLPNRRHQPSVVTIISPQPISNRLFGMSSKLKDFGKFDPEVRSESGRWNSLGELTHKLSQENNLKSVIKKEDNKRKNEKKVTFSAYTTVQVV